MAICKMRRFYHPSPPNEPLSLAQHLIGKSDNDGSSRSTSAGWRQAEIGQKQPVGGSGIRAKPVRRGKKPSEV